MPSYARHVVTIAAAIAVVLVAGCGTKYDFAGSWRSASTGATLTIGKSGNAWVVTDSKGYSGDAIQKGNELLSDGYIFKLSQGKVLVYVDGRYVMTLARE
jgi:hypothetical protein